MNIFWTRFEFIDYFCAAEKRMRKDKNIKIKKDAEFHWNVYKEPEDPLGNEVTKSKIIPVNQPDDKKRTTYWVPAIQK